MQRDGSNLRRFLNDDNDVQCGHYNWDIANRRVTLVMGGMGDKNPANLISMDIDTGDVRHYQNALQPGGQYHQSVSPDGRWVVFDAPGIPIGNSNGLHVLDQQTDTRYPLCELNCSWGKGLVDNEGKAVKSEYLHPNPSWSPDGRYVVVSTDFGGGPDAAEVYLVDFSTWNPDNFGSGKPG
jgi:Tol biopolymer transport system component